MIGFQPEEICKLCNLVFINEKMCKKHKNGDFHSRVKEVNDKLISPRVFD